MKRGKKGVAPIVTTVLLVLIVLVLATIIILWGTTFIPETLAKFDEPVENSCITVAFTAEISGSEIFIVNSGDIPIYKLKLRQEGVSSSDTQETDDDFILNVGASKSVSVTLDPEADELQIIPVILGKTEDGKIQEFQCAESSARTLQL